MEAAMKQELAQFKGKIKLPPKRSNGGETKTATVAQPAVVSTKNHESLNDVLKDLIKIDPHIKSSALVKRDGTILASAISEQISDSLVSIIATTVSNIAKDVIFATGSGDLKHVSFGGTSGKVFLVPVLADIMFVLLTGAASKRGVIEVLSRQVEKNVKAYLHL